MVGPRDSWGGEGQAAAAAKALTLVRDWSLSHQSPFPLLYVILRQGASPPMLNGEKSCPRIK